jgi:polyketide-type polyunsaturated fatty acid synthase PfaA
VTNPRRQIPVALVGLGGLFPQAEEVRRFWSNLRHGIDSIRDVPESHWRAEDYFNPEPKEADRCYAAKGGFLDPYPFAPLEFGIAPATMEAIDTTQLLGLVVAKAALADAGYLDRGFNRDKTSVVLGVTGTLPAVIPLGARLGEPLWRRALSQAGVAPPVADEVVRAIAKQYVGWQEDSFPGLLGNVVAGRSANRLDLRGTNCVVDAACASSLSALHLALLELESGRADLVVTGGCDTFNDVFMYLCFSKTFALSPTGHARPFSADGDGTTLGEGLGCLILKRLDEAERDGDRIYAVIRGLGASSDGLGHAIYAPSAGGQSQAILEAYRRAGVEPESIELVEGHGTGTKAGDLAELEGLLSVYAQARSTSRWCALGSVKSQIGHTKAAAGVAGLIKATLALYHKTLPPTLKVKTPLAPLRQPACPFYLPAEPRPWLPASSPRRAAVSAFGFGGSNFHVVLEEYGCKKTVVDWDGRVEIAAWSGNSPGDLQRQLEAVNERGSWSEVQQVSAASRRSFWADAPCRLLVVVEQDQIALAKLKARAEALLRAPPAGGFSGWPEGVYFGAGPAPGPIALLFPGQGSQRIGMLRHLILQFPEAFDELEAVELEFKGDRRLVDLIYPPTGNEEGDSDALVNHLQRTECAQPALAAVSLAAFQVLRRFGVPFNAAAGHSFGELTALAAAGWITKADCRRLALSRGALLGQAAREYPGGMVAVNVAANDARTLLDKLGTGLAIANLNGPRQTVIAGQDDELAAFIAAASERGWTARRLAVGAAFHTPSMWFARRDFQPSLNLTPVLPTHVAVASGLTGQCYPRHDAEVRTLLARQLTEPIDFGASVEELWRLGIRTFIEVGPGTVLSRLVEGILGDRGAQVLALEASGGRRSAIFDLARCLAHLAALGYPLNVTGWQEGAASHLASKSGFTIPICGANYIQPGKGGPMPTPKNHAEHASAERQATVISHIPKAEAFETLKPKAVGDMNTQSATAASDKPSSPVLSEVLAALVRVVESQADVQKQYLSAQERLLTVFHDLLADRGNLKIDSAKVTQGLLKGERVESPTLEGPVHEQANRTANWRPLGRPDPDPDALATRIMELNGPRKDAVEVQHSANGKTEGNGHPAHRSNSLTDLLRRIVAEKTGYPLEMIELDQELDTDLGIDSIKRVEIMAAVQEALPQAPVVQPEQLGKLRTLRAIAQLLTAANGAGSPGHTVQPALPFAEQIANLLCSIVAEKTGYPAEMLELGQQLDVDLGIDSIKRVEIFSALQERMPGAAVIQTEELGKLRTLGDVVRRLAEPATASAAAMPSALPCGREVSAPSFF